MKFLCKTNFWGGKSGGLCRVKQTGMKLVFMAGKKYELVPLPKKEVNSLQYLTIFAVGEDRKNYPVFHMEVNWNSNKFIDGMFDFSSLEKKSGNRNTPLHLLFL